MDNILEGGFFFFIENLSFGVTVQTEEINLENKFDQKSVIVLTGQNYH